MLSKALSQRTNRSNVSLSHETIYTILSSRRRRYAVHALKHADEEINLTELSRQITAWEIGVTPQQVEYQQRRGVYTTLKNAHLPMLDEHDLIEYNDEANTVEPSRKLAELNVYVEALQGNEIPWSLYYLGIAITSILLLFAVGVGVPGIVAIEPMGVSLFTITTFAVSGAVHHYYAKRSQLGYMKKPPEVRKRE
jgi:hypothetical protein